MDVHKATLAVSVAEAGAEVRYLVEIVSTAEAIVKPARQLKLLALSFYFAITQAPAATACISN